MRGRAWGAAARLQGSPGTQVATLDETLTATVILGKTDQGLAELAASERLASRHLPGVQVGGQIMLYAGIHGMDGGDSQGRKRFAHLGGSWRQASIDHARYLLAA